jgi:hypothetical protein
MADASQITRCYRYALMPSPVQRQAIAKATGIARRYWNSLAALERYAEHEIEHGRRGTIATKLVNILLAKKLTGVAASKARERAKNDHVPLEEAARLNRIEQAKASAKLIYAKKNGCLLRGLSNRKLAIAYAVESAEATRKKKGGCESPVPVAMTIKFQDACKLYISGKRGAPRFKRQCDSISLQHQVQMSSPNPIAGNCVRLDKLAGEVCAQVPLILHRPIPDNATIKQVALTIRGPRMFVVLMLDIAGPRCRYEMTGRVAGIDPGRKIATTVATLEGDTIRAQEPPIQPRISHDRHT